MSRCPDESLSPGCMKCEQVTGNATCFPGQCVFWSQRDSYGTKAYNVAMLDRVRRGMRETVHAPPQRGGNR